MEKNGRKKKTAEILTIQENGNKMKYGQKCQKNDHFWAHCALEINKTQI